MRFHPRLLLAEMWKSRKEEKKFDLKKEIDEF